MKKKILLIIPVLLLTCGCFSNNKRLVCSIDDEYDGIPTYITITTKFKKGKAVESVGTAVMNFESEDEAKKYLESYTEDPDTIERNGSRLTITTKQEISSDESKAKRNELKAVFEANNYKCK